MKIFEMLLPLNGITGFFLLLSACILLNRIGYKYEEKNVKRRCTRKTTGKIECISKGLYFNGIKSTKSKRRFPQRYYYIPTFVFLHYIVYSYTANGQPYSGIDSRCAYTFFSIKNMGEEVVIYYNPNDGRDFYSPYDDWNAKYGHLALIVLLLLMTAALNTLYALFYFFF